MQINVGCFYFIKDSFFDIIDDPELMKNKENGNLSFLVNFGDTLATLSVLDTDKL